MASVFNLKGVHRDGKSELKIGVDENAKIIDGIGDEIIFKNDDGTPARISLENFPFLPNNVNEKNKLVSQEDLQKIVNQIQTAIQSTNETMQSLLDLSKIVGGLSND